MIKKKEIKCRLCSKIIKKPKIVGEYVYGGTSEQKFIKCPNCNVAFQYPPISKEEEKTFYAQEFEKFMSKRSGGDYDWSGAESHIKSNQETFKRRYKIIKKHLQSNMDVLELGCSSGFMLFPLREKGLNVVGVEPSGNFSDYLKNKNIPVYVSLDELLKKNSSDKFDLIMHYFLFEHLRDPIGFLKKTYNLLKEDGIIIFEVPSRNDPLLTIYNVPAFHKFYWSVAHHWYFNRKSLEYVLKKVTDKSSYEIIPEQRYGLSNHMTWALEGKPGGTGKYSKYFTKELEEIYKENMRIKGTCDTYFVKIYK